jgi:hypothetical protein
MKNSERKVGDIATPKTYPQLRGEITEISTFWGEIVYRIKGGFYREDELEPVKEMANNG